MHYIVLGMFQVQRRNTFFDFYVIPLAKKLDKCGYFGSAAEEYLKYVQLNR